MRLVAMKLITGAFRVGVSKKLVARSIAKTYSIPVDVVAHRMMGNWTPTEEFYRQLIDPEIQSVRVSQPYPFCLAHPLDTDAGPQSLGDAADYVAEWKWDGIRGQIVRREQQTFLWSRGEELMENQWPEIEEAAQSLPDGTVLDGEILAAQSNGDVLPFSQLQRRIGRKSVGKKLRSEVPVLFVAFDILESEGQDIRELEFSKRRQLLEALIRQVDHPNILMTELVPGISEQRVACTDGNPDWDSWARAREQSREINAEGLMLKRKSSSYESGRVRGSWWKWKVAPYTIDAVLIYAQKGHGRRSGLFTDYTFALWENESLVPFAKAYSGLSDAEIRKVDRFVRSNTRESFGPVRSVTPTLVMELAFEGLQASKRHKSGIATRFPRILRWRHDKKPTDANSLDDLRQLLPAS